MGRVEPPESPLSVAAAADTDVAAAFGLLGNKTRLAILLALWEAYDPHGESDGIPFSELRTRVGVADSGQFNYHLGKLEGQFVTKTADGYGLHPVGLGLVQTIVAGAGQERPFDPVAIDVECHRCGAATELTYEHGWLYHRCTSCEGVFSKPGSPRGVLFGEPFPAAALQERTPAEIFAAGVYRLLSVTASKVAGVCPRCSAAVEARLLICDTHDVTETSLCERCGNAADVRVQWLCSVCKYAGSAAPASVLITHPAVVAFYHAHGVEIGYPIDDLETARDVLSLMRSHEQELVSTYPPRIRVTVRYGADSLELLVDDRLRVIELRPDSTEERLVG